MADEIVSENDLQLLQDPDLITWKHRIIYTVLFYSGLRASELLTLKPRQLRKRFNSEDNRNEYFIRLEQQKNKEINEDTPLRERDYADLISYIQANDVRSHEFVFTSRLKKHNTVEWLNRCLKTQCKKLGIMKNITSHSFRKGRVTQLKRKGYGYAEIAAITRHKNIRVMQKHYDKQIKSRAFEIVNSN